MPRPDIHEYLDYRAYLADWYAWKKARDAEISHRSVARAIGDRSPSFFSDVVKGRRNLTPSRRDALVGLLELDAEAARFFVLLVELDQAQDVTAKRRAWTRLRGHQRFGASRRVEGQSYAYLAHWYYPAVRELVRTKGFRADPAWISARLRPRISEQQAKEALDALWSLGMLDRDADGAVVQADGDISTPRQVQGLAVHEYHHGMLERARESIASVEPDERHFIGVTISIPESLLPRLKQELDELAASLLEVCEDTDDEPERVFQVNLNLVPLSASGEEP